MNREGIPQLAMILRRDYFVFFPHSIYLLHLLNPLFIPVFCVGLLQIAGTKNLLAQDSTLCIGQSSNAFISYVSQGKGSQDMQKTSSMVVFPHQ